MPYIQAKDGTRLFVREWGEGRAVLFLHSWALSSQIWDDQMLALAEAGYRTIAFDRRGHGRSDIPPDGYDYDTLADDIAAVIRTLNLDQVALVGHSMGCGEAVRYLTRHGSSRVARLALVAPATPCLLQAADNPEGLPAAAFEAMRAAWREDFPKWISDNAEPFVGPETSAAKIAWITAMMLQTPVSVAIACNRTIAEADLRAEMKAIAIPSLVIHGDRDASAPLALTGQPTAALLPNGRLELYEGAPHGLMFTHAERLNRDLLAFLRAS